MPSKTPKQAAFMQAVAKNPKFAKKAGVPSKVGKEFMAKDKKGYAGGGEVRGYGAARKSGCKGM